MIAERNSAVVADTAFPHYVDWGAIFLGAFIASAVSMVLFAFGTGIGLSMVSPYEGEGVSKTAYFVTMGLWTIWVIVLSSVIGGYIAGRLRRRIGDATEHEVDVRDSAHGLGVWALGVVAAALFVALGVSGVVGAATKVAGAGAATAVAADAKDPNTATVDALFRAPAGTATAQASTTMTTDQNAPAMAPAATPTPAPARDKAADRAEIGRMLATQMVRGEMSPDNKRYIASVIAANTNMTQAEAEQRVDQVLAEAKRKADAARKAGVLIAFITAASLLVGAAAAAGAATMGGRHRDQNVDTSAFWRWA